ncbi:hypothetical protein C0Q70_18683 [Pomacea canaliculata]|uniref:DUF1279 domain-containing protein n=2 Tax=Pomacea canaliculata TaxID=400727 RepID=A0A2T7NH70_POMCA|nr:hypothetical protein C0Q70_18683 [Pomacea canaliculata]
MRVSLQSFGLRQAYFSTSAGDLKEPQLKHAAVMVEGIQGPVARPLSIQESKQLLQRALAYASKGLSLQGIQQECCFHTFNTNMMAAQKTTSFENELAESASPQGIQGTPNMEMGCGHFQAWLDNCRRYGLSNCDQQLQGIQTGRLTLSQVLAEQEALIAEISEGYRKRSEAQAAQFDENIQGAQGNMRLPDVSIPCPQGVQGDDCVRFKLWLENCQRFNLHDCVEQLQGFQSGRVTLAQIFAQQDAMIKDIVQIYQQKRSYSTQPERRNDLSGTAQVGGLTAESQLTQREKLKRAVKEYGSTVIIFHVAISLASLGGFYLAVSSGIDLVGILRNVGVGETVLQSKLATGTGTFVVAYAVHKVFAPVRIAITLTATPFIVRYLRRIGALKPPKKVP